MEFLIALIPALCWGSIALVSTKLGGTVYNQTLGMTIGAVLFSVVAFFVTQPVLDFRIFLAGLFSGLFWSLGQAKQFQTMKLIGVSSAIPVSSGLQLIANTLAGAFLFREWTEASDVTIGFVALVLLVFGIRFISVTDEQDEKGAAARKAGARTLAVSTLGYVMYTIIMNMSGADAVAVLLPQSVGMLAGASLFAYGNKVRDKYTVRNIVSGLLWAVGNVALLISMRNIGLAVSFSLSQMGIVISTLGGVWLLGEMKSKREFRYAILGCFLVVLGGVLTGYIRS